MAAALSLAARNLGQTWPNPAVGCVIVDAAGHVVGRGFTQPRRPAARRDRSAEDGRRRARKGGTAYVTLEPCSHHGKTPPCAEALVAAGIKRCVAAIEDPDPRVSGRGLAKLREAGIAVETGVLADAGAGSQRRLPDARHRRAAVGRTEAGHLAGRPDRHPRRREPLDHRGGGAGIRPPAARHARRHRGRVGHGAGGRSGTDLPHSRPGASFAGPAGVRPARPHPGDGEGS